MLYMQPYAAAFTVCCQLNNLIIPSLYGLMHPGKSRSPVALQWCGICLQREVSGFLGQSPPSARAYGSSSALKEMKLESESSYVSAVKTR